MRHRYRLILHTPRKRIRKKSDDIGIVHGGLAVLILEDLNIAAEDTFGFDKVILQ